MNGSIKIPAWPEIPPELNELVMYNKEFREQIRAYNTLFSFTSTGYSFKGGVNLGLKGHGPPIFRLQGQMVHRFVEVYT